MNNSPALILALLVLAFSSGCRSETYEQDEDGSTKILGARRVDTPRGGSARLNTLLKEANKDQPVDPKETTRVLNEAWRESSDDASAARALYQSAEAEFEAGRLRAAYLRYRVLQERFPRANDYRAAVERIFAIGQRALTDGSEDSAGFFLFGESDAEFGVRVLDDFVINFDRHPRAAEAIALIARAKLDEREPEESILWWERLRTEYPRSPLVPRADLSIPLARLTINDDVERDRQPMLDALAELREFLRRYPAADLTSEAEEALNKLEEVLARHELVIARRYRRYLESGGYRIYLEHLIQEYPKTPAAAIARESLEEFRTKGTEGWSFWDRFGLGG